MDIQEFLLIKNQLPEFRRKLVNSLYGPVPKSVDFLDRAISAATSEDVKASLYPLLLGECARHGNRELLIRFLRRQVVDLENDPLSLTSLAMELSRDKETQREALKCASEAVALAKRQDRQVRYSLTSQARVALNVGDYNIFNSALRDLIEDAGVHRAEDHGLESDFLQSVDSTWADSDLVAAYRALAVRGK